MTDKLEYCAECGFILPMASAYGKPYVTCGPCGAKVHDRMCLGTHKRYCAPSLEAKGRKAALKR